MGITDTAFRVSTGYGESANVFDGLGLAMISIETGNASPSHVSKFSISSSVSAYFYEYHDRSLTTTYGVLLLKFSAKTHL